MSNTVWALELKEVSIFVSNVLEAGIHNFKANIQRCRKCTALRSVLRMLAMTNTAVDGA